MKNYISLFLFFITSSAYSQFCTSDTRFTEVEYFDVSEIDSVTDIQYGTAIDHFGNLDTLLLDAFFPNDAADPLDARPVVVMIHGGAFRIGQKEQRWGECMELAKRGYVTFSINYRLGWDTNTPSTQVLAIYRAHQDAHAAIRYIVDNGASFQIDPNWIFVGGTSAGANTSNNLVYTSQSDYEAAYPGIGSLLGNLLTSTNTSTTTFSLKGIFNNWGGAFTNSVQASEMVPQIAFHGENDLTVDIDTSTSGNLLGSRALHYTLLNNSICSDLTVDPLGRHGVYTNPAGTIFRSSRTSCFFKSIFCSSCTDFYAIEQIAAECSVSTETNIDAATIPYQWLVSPNPFNDFIQISNLEESTKINLCDLNGTIIYTGSQISNVDFSHLSSGIYVLSVENDFKIEHFKIIKK